MKFNIEDYIEVVDFLPKWMQSLIYILENNGKISGYGLGGRGPGRHSTLKEYNELENGELLVLTYWDENGGKAYELDILNPDDKDYLEKLATDYANARGTFDEYELIMISKEGELFDLKPEVKKVITVSEVNIVNSDRFP